MNLKILISAFILSAAHILPQNSPDSSAENIDYFKLGMISGLTAGAIVYGHAVQSHLWWKGEKSKFHFEWDYDWKYALGADKFGHFFFPYLTANTYSQLLRWSGFNKKRSLLYAGIFALAYQTYVEIKDGYSKEWGFSWGDYSANVLGAAYPLLQNNFQLLKNFNFKISFYPSQRFKHGSNKVIFDDYESTYNWLSVNVYSLLPSRAKKYYPKFINIALGHSVKGLNNLDNAYHEFYIALDWNLENLPGNGWLLKLLKRNFNYYHFPSPAIKIYPGVVWYGLKF